MRRTISAAAVLAAAVLLSANACGPGVSNVPAQQILDLINAERATAGCAAIAGSDQLRVAAERHAVDMRNNPAIRSSHTGSDGSTPSTRIKDAGFAPTSRTGEIMYWASGAPGNSAKASVDWWINSPPHRAIITDCRFTHAGVGLVYPNGVEWYTTVDFGAH